MTHRQLIVKFKHKLRQNLTKSYFFYKIPDTRGLGGLRPFDAILQYGKSYAIEFKTKRDTLRKHQEYCLDVFSKSGGISIVIKEGDDMDKIIQIIKKGGEKNG